MIKMLIEDGADINAINKDKNSALIIAATEGRKQSLTYVNAIYIDWCSMLHLLIIPFSLFL